MIENLDKKVTLIEGLDDVMSTQFDADFSEKIQSALEEENIEVLTGEMIEKFDVENGKVNRVQTSNKEVEHFLTILEETRKKVYPQKYGQL